MTQLISFKCVYQDEFLRPLFTEQVVALDVERAISVALDLTALDKRIWAFELHNRAGFVLRVMFSPATAAVAKLTKTPMTRQHIKRPHTSSQLSLAL